MIVPGALFGLVFCDLVLPFNRKDIVCKSHFLQILSWLLQGIPLGPLRNVKFIHRIRTTACMHNCRPSSRKHRGSNHREEKVIARVAVRDHTLIYERPPVHTPEIEIYAACDECDACFNETYPAQSTKKGKIYLRWTSLTKSNFKVIL